MFVIVGDKARDQVQGERGEEERGATAAPLIHPPRLLPPPQVVNLHYLLAKTVVKARPSVLWCYKKELHVSSHRAKRARQVQRLAARGLLNPDEEDPFSLFVAR
jgi:hypothetical protein